jgi:prepilin-type processing-associated H-X9-DG protein
MSEVRRLHRPEVRLFGDRGITIVEVLLVAAVLAVLATMLLPVFVRGRELSHRARCAANLRQFAAAFTLYAQDCLGWWPSPGGLAGDYAYWAQTGNGGLQGYVRQRGLGSVWCCPHLDEWHGRFSPRSYSMNSYLRTPADVEYPGCINYLRGISIERICEPRRTILLYEGIPRSSDYADKAYTEDQVYYIYRCANWTWARGYYAYAHTVNPMRPWHGTRNNYLYCDGHIVARPPGRRIPATLSTYKEMSEWYVDKAYFERIYQKNWSRLVPKE